MLTLLFPTQLQMVFAKGSSQVVTNEVTGNQKENNRQLIKFNTDWRYKKGEVTGAQTKDFDDSSWVYVNLPHTTTFYTPETKDAYLGISWYRKQFSMGEEWQGKKLLLRFEVAMQNAQVWVNGEMVFEHKGVGYPIYS